MSKRVTKLFTTKASSIDEEAKSVTFVISTVTVQVVARVS
jgi:hypothetical protein